MGTRRTSLAALTLCLAVFWPGKARAGWMTYTETATATGSLGGVKFTDAKITFTQTADTGSVKEFGQDYAGYNYLSTAAAVTSSVTISGVGQAKLAVATDVFANRGSWEAGIIFHSNRLIVLSVSEYAFRDYDLGGPIGPITGTALYSEQKVDTDRGLLTFQPVQYGVVFSATPFAVPEPPAAFLILAGLGMAYIGHRCHATRRHEAG